MHCTRKTISSDPVARAEGWRWYDGLTQGGKHLVDVVCPVCAGATEAATDERWNVGCTTCSWSHEEDRWEGDEPLLNAKEARSLAFDHQCEPELWIRSPDGTEYRPDDFDHDGKLRKADPDRVLHALAAVTS